MLDYYSRGKQVEKENSKITIQDVADALGVSKTTVSRAISGKGRVGEATRNRVLAYIDEHNYVPNAMAKGLAQSRTFNIGLSVPADFVLSDLPFFHKALVGISQVANDNHYDVVISMNDNNNITHLERMISNQKVDGVILSRTFFNDNQIALLKKHAVPFVTMGSYDDADIYKVDHNHSEACEKLTNMLFEQGIKKIALICGSENHVVNKNREKGFRNALIKKNIYSEECVFKTEFQTVDECVDKIIQARFDCIICMDDSICVKAIERLNFLKLKIPKDIKIASFYNSSLLENNVPSVTSINFSPMDMGTAACKAIMNILDGSETDKLNLLEYEIKLGESTS